MEGTTVERRHIIFYGRVQGVGFRYKASYSAKSLGLTGWVKNEDDGTVVMEVQGSKVLIKKLILNLCSDRYIRIEGMDNTQIPLKANERGFGTRGY